MRNNITYQQFKATVAGYDEAQINAVTKTQVQTQLGVALGDRFFANMKKVAIDDFHAAGFQNKLVGLKEQLTGGGRVWLINNFPDVEFEKGKIENKRFITIWLEGKPNG